MANPGDPLRFGGRSWQDPEDFITEVQHRMMDRGQTTDQEKARYLRLSLEARSPAHGWFGGLDQAVLADWGRLEAAFRARWIPIQTHTRSNIERTTDLLKLKLDPKDIGTMVPHQGETAHAHLAWAEEVEALVQDLGLITRGEYIQQVTEGLPKAVQDSIEGQVTDWTTFLAAIRAINVRKLKGQAETESTMAEKASKSELEELRALVNSLSLSTAGAATVTPQTRQTQQSTTNTRASQGAGGTSRGRQPRAPPTDADKAAVQQKLTAYPHQLDTDTGRATYRRQMAQWTANRNASDPVTEATPVPLRPGTATMCSSECFKCGTHGHRAARCVLADNHPARLSSEESRWRAICGSILGPVNRTQAQDVHLVFDGQGSMRLEWGAEDTEQEEGKGEGSSA
jgi:hypothetical protein